MSSRDKKTLKPSSSRSGSGRIRTLSDLNRPSGGHDSDSDSDGPQEYYIGGERRLISTLLPSNPSSFTSSLFLINWIENFLIRCNFREYILFLTGFVSCFFITPEFLASFINIPLKV